MHVFFINNIIVTMSDRLGYGNVVHLVIDLPFFPLALIALLKAI